MHRSALFERRPHSSAPGEVSSSGTYALSNAPRSSGHLRVSLCPSPRAAYFPTPASLFRDSYGLPASGAVASVGRHYEFSNGRLHANASDGCRHVSSRHHDVAQSPSTQRPPPPPRRAATAGASTRPSPAANGSSAADAVVYQYYSQRQRRRAQHGAASSSQDSEPLATPVRRQPFKASSGGLSAPATPIGGATAALYSPLPSHSSCRLTARGRCGDIHSRLHHHSSELPSPTDHESVIHDTSTSLVPVTPSEDEGRWPEQLTPSQHQQCEGLVRLLAQLPAAQAHRVLLATIRQYEAHRLLQHYGGVHALPGADLTPRAMPRSPSTSSQTSSSGKLPSGRRQGDGRSALFEALRAHLHDMQRADLAAQALSPFTAAARHRQRRAGSRADGLACEESHINYSIAAHPPARPPPTAARRPQLARQQLLQDSAQQLRDAENVPRSGTGAGNARAPRHLRSRVLASRVARPRIRSTQQGVGKSGNGSAPCHPSSSMQTKCSPRPPLDFMQTIKPPHRHGLAGALLLSSGPAAEAVTAAHVHNSSERATAPLDAQNITVAGLGKGVREAGLHRPASTAERSTLPSSPSALAATAIGGEAAPDSSGDWPLPTGATLSPGAAAARRAYWERQQKEQQPSLLSRANRNKDEGQAEQLESALVRCSNSTHGRKEEARCRPRSTSTECLGAISSTPGAAPSGSASFEDSVRRGEVLPLAYEPTVAPGPSGAKLRDVQVPSETLAPPLGIRTAWQPPPRHEPHDLLSTRAMPAMAPPLEGVQSPAAAFMTDLTGAPISAQSAPMERPYDHEGSRGADAPAELPSSDGAFVAGAYHATADAGISSRLYEKRPHGERGDGAGLSTAPRDSEGVKELDARHLLVSQAEFEDDVVTASSIRSESPSQEQAKRNDYDGAVALPPCSTSGAVGSGLREADESADEVKLPWET
ncbi:hypothetical protein LSCM1_03264 [Leishmania martiniquensis]|uniref:Uncharacterized protein n=1 Tax=Leishmania martiniquensis TaxID=1580590 RepID=A0A836GIR5_9TRYP|nr:hypothetical protein LSCM1_03264 [Leishmania martiniquensis]